MDRLNKVHLASRVQLPKSITDYGNAGASAGQAPRSFPILPRYVGIIAFMTGGAIVIAAASFIALSI